MTMQARGMMRLYGWVMVLALLLTAGRGAAAGAAGRLAPPAGARPYAAAAAAGMAFTPAADAASLAALAPAGATVTQTGGGAALYAAGAVTPAVAAAAAALSGADQVVQVGAELAVVVPAGAARPGGQARVALRALPQPRPAAGENRLLGEPGGARPLLAFELTAEVTAPVRLGLDLRGVGADGRFYLAYQDAANPDLWHELPLTVHQADGLASAVAPAAVVQSGSAWTAGVRPERWTPGWTPPTVAGFSGAATAGYAVAVPPGRGGLQPAVTLSYSSRALDGQVRQVEAGDVAHGWTLAEVSIVREGVALRHESNGHPAALHPDRYRLVLDGTGHELVAQGDAQSSELAYVAQDAPGLRVVRYYDAAAPNREGLFWVVTTAAGTQYRLGYTADSESWQQVSGAGAWINLEGGHEGRPNNGTSAMAWRVDTVTDVHGNQMTYLYYTRMEDETLDWYDAGGQRLTMTLATQQVRLANIRYNFAARVAGAVDPWVARQTGAAATRISFRAATDDTSLGRFEDGISSIYVFHGSNSAPVREVRLRTSTKQLSSPGCQGAYANTTLETRQLDGVRLHVGVDADPGTADMGYALPETTYTYTPLAHYMRNGQEACFSYQYLSGEANGYGGETQFSYAVDGRSVGAFRPEPALGYDVYSWPEMGYHAYVTGVVQLDGQGGRWETTLDYAGACYRQHSAYIGPLPGARTCGSGPTPYVGPLLGFAEVTRTQRDAAGQAVSREVTTYAQGADETLGRPLVTRAGAAVGAAGLRVLRQTETAYATVSAGGGGRFTYAAVVTATAYHDGLGSAALRTVTETAYEEAAQGGRQWGQPTRQTVRTWDGAGVETAVTTWTLYVGDESRWLHVPWATGAYAGGGQALAIQLLLYDGNDSGPESQALTRGLLTLQRTLLLDGEDSSGGVTRYPSVDVATGYDAYGHATEMTTYQAYGEAGYDAAGVWTHSVAAVGGMTTTTTYAGPYALYPTAVRDGLGQETQFGVYGFGEPLGGYQLQAGELARVVPANGVETVYEYDPFGRLYATYESTADRGNVVDKEDGYPTARYLYWDNNWMGAVVAPFGVTQQVWPNPRAGAADVFGEAVAYYDGQGREVQTRTRQVAVEGVGEQDVIVLRAYGALGETACQTAPFGVAPGTGMVTEACGGRPGTATAVDALGRPTVVTGVDGSQTWYQYTIADGLAYTDVINAARQRRQTAADGRGQVVAVREFAGDCAAGYWTGTGLGCGGSHTTPWTVYATTGYGYDAAGNLARVTDAAGNEMLLGYDALGRKVTMADPDMGTWTYAYDAVGNLVRQEANGETALCFAYDGLNRLLSKRRDDSVGTGCADAAAVLATYSYYTSGAGQAGQLAEVRWPDGANRETYGYDSRGRLVAHRRWIDGREYAMGYGSFDALGRPWAVTYPSGETVSVRYDGEGVEELAVTAGGQGVTLVDGVGYTVLGQLARIDRAAAELADTRYTYADAGGGYRLERLAAGSMLDFRYGYDAVGNVAWLTDALSGETEQFGYDALGRLERVSGAYGRTYSYDEIGNLLRRDGVVYDYTPDPQRGYGHVQPHAVTGVGGDQYGYDAAGNMVRREESGRTTLQAFDGENRLVRATVLDAGVTTFAYDADGQRVKTRQADGRVVYTPFGAYEEEVQPGLTCDGLVAEAEAGAYRGGFVAEADAAASGGAALGVPEGFGTRLGGADGAQAVTVCFVVTEAGPYRLTGWFRTPDGGSDSVYVGVNGRPQSGGLRWELGVHAGYEAVTLGGGQPLTAQLSAGTHRVTVYLREDGVWLDRLALEPVLPAVTFTAGGVTDLVLKPGEDEYTLAWSSVNATSCVASGDWHGSKPLAGSEVWQIGQATATQVYVLTCGSGVGSTSRTVTVTPDGGSCGAGCPPPPASALTVLVPEERVRRSSYELAGQVLAQRTLTETGGVVQGQALHYVYSDHLGSATRLAAGLDDPRTPGNERGQAVTGLTRYYPYGGYRTGGGNDISDRGFTGHRHNDELGLVYMNARYYLPGIGRFASADTLVPDPANPQSFNRYSYVHNQPLNHTDPTGHWIESIFDIASIAYDIYEISQDGLTVENGLALVADVGGLLLPGVTGGGAAVRALTHADEVVDVVTHADELADAVHYADNLVDAAQHVDEATEGFAVVRAYNPTPTSDGYPHYSVEVHYGNSVLVTEQVATEGMQHTWIGQVHYPRPPEQTATIMLPDAGAAQQYQQSMIGQYLGPYSVNNNCITHVCEVLRAGGADGVPAYGRGGIRDISYVKNDLGLSQVWTRRR